MKTKNILTSVLLTGLTVALASCGGSSNNTAAPAASNASNASSNAQVTENASSNADNFQSQVKDDTLVVANGQMNGDFVEGFTNNAYDVVGRKMMGSGAEGGYLTYAPNQEGKFVVDKTVNASDPEIKDNEDGSKTVTFKLNPDLKWSDGSPVTADDYLAVPLLISYKDFAALTSSTSVAGDKLKGYKAYMSGESDVFEGVQKIDDHTFSITVDKDFLPYFNEASMFSLNPIPIHKLNENIAISKEGNKLVAKDGYKLDDAGLKKYKDQLDKSIADKKKELEEAKKSEDFASSDQEKFDKEIKTLEDKKAAADSGKVDASQLLIEETALYYTNEYRYRPVPSSGPYKFDAYENNMLKLSLNEHYLGNFEGKKATIPHVILQYVNDKISLDILLAGQVDVVEQMADADKISQVIKAQEDKKVNTVTFNRDGYGLLEFQTDLGATKYKEVRQAIAFLIDRNEFVQSILGGYGVVTNGCYGLSQWMYEKRGADLEQKLVNYTYNVDEANKRLDKSPYTFEKDGKTPWDANKAKEAYEKNPQGFDYWRYDKDGNKLQVNQYGAEEVQTTTLLNNQLPDHGKQVGLEYVVQAGDFATLLNYLYFPDVKNPKFTAYNLGNSFSNPFDPWYQYSKDGNDNKTRTNDPAVEPILDAMRHTKPGDEEAYLDQWEKFQVWFNDYMPEIPLYSNTYYNATSPRVQNYTATPTWGIGYQINYVTLGK